MTDDFIKKQVFLTKTFKEPPQLNNIQGQDMPTYRL